MCISCVHALCSQDGQQVSRGVYCCFQGLSYGVFGLGNKQYEHFCAVGKRVHKALGALGGKALVRRGDGDDDEDIEADFESWRTELYAGLDKSDVLVKTTANVSP